MCKGKVDNVTLHSCGISDIATFWFMKFCIQTQQETPSLNFQLPTHFSDYDTFVQIHRNHRMYLGKGAPNFFYKQDVYSLFRWMRIVWPAHRYQYYCYVFILQWRVTWRVTYTHYCLLKLIPTHVWELSTLEWYYKYLRNHHL